MNETNQGQQQPETAQRDLIESGQRAIRESMELPLNQTVEFQRNLAKMFMTGLEMQDWAQRQAIELMKTTFGNYLNTMESTAQGMSQATQATVQSAMETGQGTQFGATGERASQVRGSQFVGANQQRPIPGQQPRAAQGFQGYRQPQAGRGFQEYRHPPTHGQPPAGQQFQSYQQPQGGQRPRSSQQPQGGQGFQGGQQPPTYGEPPAGQWGQEYQQTRTAGEPQEYEQPPEQQPQDRPADTR